MVNDMGLLEKADKMQSTDPSPEPTPQPEPVVSPEPVPVAAKEKKTKKSRRKSRSAKVKRDRVVKKIPDGFEEASNGQKAIRRLSDFMVSWGWSIPIVGMNAWGTTPDMTYFIIAGIGLMFFNLGFMPRSTGRTVGNWVSRTTYVNSNGVTPTPIYVLIKGLTFVIVLVGLLFVATSIQDVSETSGQILLAIGLFLLLPPTLDYLFVRLKRDNLGLWDTLFGGVWLVKTTKTAEAKGWLKKLEQLGDYSAERGWWDDKDASEPPETGK